MEICLEAQELKAVVSVHPPTLLPLCNYCPGHLGAGSVVDVGVVQSVRTLGQIWSSENNKWEYKILLYCHNPNINATQHNLNTAVGLDMKMAVHTTQPHPNPSSPPKIET